MPPVTLSTARLVLRPWRFDDVEAVADYANDREFFRYLPVAYPETAEDHARFIAAQRSLDPATHPSWAITLDSVPIGGTNVRIELEHRSAEVGYGVARAHWGKGFASESAKAVMDWTFRTFAVDRFAATADARNIASWRVMEKLGMQREGLLRSHRIVRGDPSDTVVYAILREEWERRLP